MRFCGDAFKDGIKDEKIIATILKDVLNALVFLQSWDGLKGIDYKDVRVHGAVKPKHIMVADDGTFMLSDAIIESKLIRWEISGTQRRVDDMRGKL